MDNAKFCPAAQGWSTSESVNSCLLLRQHRWAKQEQDHDGDACAMPLRCGFSSRTRNTGSPLWQNKTKAPRKFRGAAVLLFASALGRSLGLNLGLGFAVATRDLTRLFCLGDFAHEIYVQQTVLEAGVLDLDVVGKLEDALKSARGDALIEHFAVLLF